MRAKEFVTEYKKYPTQEYEGVTFTMMEKDRQLIVKALNDFGNAMGYVVFTMDGKELDPKDLAVDDRYQGQGIARTMYDYIKSRGFTINRSFDQTDAGRGFWDKHRGEDSYVWEGVDADQVLQYVKRAHAPEQFDIEHSITDHPAWELKNIPLSQLNLDPEGETQDPYGRVNWVDWDKVQDLLPNISAVLKRMPIVVDSQGWIIDGNHRATAAAEAGLKSVPAYVPVSLNENMDHSKDGRAVEELRAALIARKEKLQAASDDQVYDIIDKIMTRIAKSHSISGQQLHDMWVDKYKQIPDTWIMNENFADGKKPGRKGLAKRVGVNCKQPVSKLRSIAAHSSGEKQRMAHWCANMKSGKKKANEEEEDFVGPYDGHNFFGAQIG